MTRLFKKYKSKDTYSILFWQINKLLLYSYEATTTFPPIRSSSLIMYILLKKKNVIQEKIKNGYGNDH